MNSSSGRPYQCTSAQQMPSVFNRSAYPSDFISTPQTASMIHTFLFVMVLFPHVQRKAHNEILSVIGTSRLPDIKDRPLLPYVDAILKETLRWHPPVPLGIFYRLIHSILCLFNCQVVHTSYRRMKFSMVTSLRKEAFVWPISGLSLG
jgi:hypothetical protein